MTYVIEAVLSNPRNPELGLNNIKDFINLTFCSQKATVITDFSDLEQVGREHYINLHGGCAKTEELENLDGFYDYRSYGEQRQAGPEMGGIL